MNLLPCAAFFARKRPVMSQEAPLLVPIADGPAASGLSAGPLGVGALAFGCWMLGRLRSRRHEPHSAEV
jgi:hypothetical protein